MLRFLVGNLESSFCVQKLHLYNKYMWVLMASFSFIVEYTKENNIGISNKICLWIIYIYILRLKDTMKRYSFICFCVADQYTI